MFRKRNFSIINSPSTSHLVSNGALGSPAKRTRLGLSSTIRTPSIQASRSNSIDESPILPRPKLTSDCNEGNACGSLNLNGKFSSRMFQGGSTLLLNQPTVTEGSLNSAIELNTTAKKLTSNDIAQATDQTVDPHGLDRPMACSEKIYTPPPTPSSKSDSRVEALKKQKAQLQLDLKALDEIIEAKFMSIKMIREKTIELQAKRFKFDDYLDLANKSQAEVRNSLNDIYNPSVHIADQATQLIEEVKKRHEARFEKLSFEMYQRLDGASKAIQRKTKELEHNVKLHERTLMTIEVHKRQQSSPKVEELSQPDEAAIVKNSDPEIRANDNNFESQMVETKTDQTDDDCVIIDDDGASTNEIGLSARTPPDNQDTDASVGNHSAANHSATTATCESEDEETDIEETNNEDGEEEDEEEEEIRSFTPCQAQRPR